MGFLDSYKHLEKLCGEVMNDNKRLSAYIDAMENTRNGAFRVEGWDEDFKKLKHYRWVRNQITHEPACSEANMCEPGDEIWLEQFYARIMNQTDPLALYRKATRPQPVSKRQTSMSHSTSESQNTYVPNTTRRKQQQNKPETPTATNAVVVFAIFLFVIIVLFYLFVNK